MVSSLLHRASGGVHGEENPLWLVVLCDIMTNLMLFFLIMYAFTLQPTENRKEFLRGLMEGNGGPLQKEEHAEKVVQQYREQEGSRALSAALKSPELREHSEVQVTDKQIRMRLDAPVLFKQGEAELSSGAREALKPVGALLASLHDQIVVEGYTDNVPISHSAYRTNWELSIGRAYSVIQYLSGLGIPESRFVIAGYGEYRPVESNATAQGRARNRRIEIVLVRGGMP